MAPTPPPDQTIPVYFFRLPQKFTHNYVNGPSVKRDTNPGDPPRVETNEPQHLPQPLGVRAFNSLLVATATDHT